jgi:hypothetical protein
MNAKPRQKQKGNARMTRDELLKERPNRRREKQHAITKGQGAPGVPPETSRSLWGFDADEPDDDLESYQDNSRLTRGQ